MFSVSPTQCIPEQSNCYLLYMFCMSPAQCIPLQSTLTPTCPAHGNSNLLMTPLMKMGMVTGKTERQTASWLKSATAVNRSAALKLVSSIEEMHVKTADMRLDSITRGLQMMTCLPESKQAKRMCFPTCTRTSFAINKVD